MQTVSIENKISATTQETHDVHRQVQGSQNEDDDGPEPPSIVDNMDAKCREYYQSRQPEVGLCQPYVKCFTCGYSTQYYAEYQLHITRKWAAMEDDSVSGSVVTWNSGEKTYICH